MLDISKQFAQFDFSVKNIDDTDSVISELYEQVWFLFTLELECTHALSLCTNPIDCESVYDTRDLAIAEQEKIRSIINLLRANNGE